jgi:hypothetical protein
MFGTCTVPRFNSPRTPWKKDMDDLADDEEVQLTRHLEQLRQTKRQIEKREKHANVQAKYRARLEKNSAPTRMDFAIVTLGIVLRSIDREPEHHLIQLLRTTIECELVDAGFDREQIRVRLGRMLDNCEGDIAKWRRSRAWLREHKARLAKAGI